MHEAQAKDHETQTEAKKPRNLRPYKFYVSVKHRQLNTDGTTATPEFLEFPDKVALREALGQPKFDGADIRIVRGYEMNVRAKRSVSVN